MTRSDAYAAAAFVDSHQPPRPAEVIETAPGEFAVLIHSWVAAGQHAEYTTETETAHTPKQVRDILGY